MNLIKELLSLNEDRLDELVQLPPNASIEDLNRRLEACKRALALVAKLPKEERGKWLSQTFKNMNIIRGALKRAEKAAANAPVKVRTQTDDMLDRLHVLELQLRQMAKENGATVREDSQFVDGTPIPARVKRFMNDSDIHYPGVHSMEQLKKAHAQQILNKGGWSGADSDERGLAHTLGIANLSNDELEKVVNPPVHSKNDWQFSANDIGFSGEDTLYGPIIVNKQYVIVGGRDHDGDQLWECGVLDVENGHQPLMDEYVWAENRSEVEEWLDNNGLPHPLEDDFKKLGL